MSDRDKVIKAVDSCFDYWLDQHRYLHPLELETVRKFKADALALLKEQEAVKPIAKEDDTFECVCGAIVGWEELDSSGIVATRLNYCPYCGKAVKWE